ncbi:MAG: hypothetical protein VW455_06115 [Nitrospinota bacterium]
MVFQQAEKHSYPGGALTAGYDSLEYFLIIKPLAIIEELKLKAQKFMGASFAQNKTDPENHVINKATLNRRIKHLMDKNFPQHNKEYFPEPGDAKAFPIIDSVFEYTLSRYAQLAKEYNFVFLLIDRFSAYKPFLKEAREKFGVSIIHIDANEWKKDVEDPGEKLPPILRNVPKDGHYAVGYNRLIAEKIASVLKENSIKLKPIKNSE